MMGRKIYEGRFKVTDPEQVHVIYNLIDPLYLQQMQLHQIKNSIASLEFGEREAQFNTQ